MTARNLQAVVYTADDGTNFQTWMDATVFAQTGTSTNVKVGGSDYDGSPVLMNLRASGLRPRGVYVLNASRRKFVVCLQKGSELYDGTETTVDLLELGSAAAVTFTRYNYRPEGTRRVANPAG